MKSATTTAWDRRKLEQRQIDSDNERLAMKVGAFGVVIVLNIYCWAIYFAVQLLEGKGVIDFRLKAWECGLIALGYIIVRGVDRTFFRDRTK